MVYYVLLYNRWRANKNWKPGLGWRAEAPKLRLQTQSEPKFRCSLGRHSQQKQWDALRPPGKGNITWMSGFWSFLTCKKKHLGHLRVLYHQYNLKDQKAILTWPWSWNADWKTIPGLGGKDTFSLQRHQKKLGIYINQKSYWSGVQPSFFHE